MTLKRFNYLPDCEQAKLLLDELSQQSIPDPRRHVDRPLILYGAGNLGRMAKQYFERIGIPIDAVVDKQAEQYRRDDFWTNTEIFHPDEVDINRRQQVLLAVCVANICYSELEQALVENGWHDVVHFYDIAEAYRDRHPLSNGWFCDELRQDDCESIYQVMQCWDDNASRAYHLQFIAWRHLRQDWLFSEAPMMTENRYLIPEVKSVLHDHEVFVDIGGHHGETSQLLLEAVDFNYEQLWLFEPDLSNLNQLKSRLAALTNLDNNKIHLDNHALGSKKSVSQFFDGAGYASQITMIGNKQVDVVPFDSLDIPVSFMKLHLEGTELDALQGAKHALLRYRPIVAMTSYHNQLGLYEMAQWLMETLSGYRFIYRMHSGCGTGAVIYAIPNERYCH
ncbi:MAG: FkbM family methyltransferase [Gammaproteobacteria bacterium]|nr:FkbM family methyltransferase [Gammaproteobacteria bacterium]